MSARKVCDVCIFLCVCWPLHTVRFVSSAILLSFSCGVVSFFYIVLCCVFCIVLFQGLCVAFFVVVIYYIMCMSFFVLCVRCFCIYCVVIFFLRFFYSCDMFGFHAVVYVFMFFMYCCVVKKVV